MTSTANCCPPAVHSVSRIHPPCRIGPLYLSGNISPFPRPPSPWEPAFFSLPALSLASVTVRAGDSVAAASPKRCPVCAQQVQEGLETEEGNDTSKELIFCPTQMSPVRSLSEISLWSQPRKAKLSSTGILVVGAGTKPVSCFSMRDLPSSINLTQATVLSLLGRSQCPLLASLFPYLPTCNEMTT